MKIKRILTIKVMNEMMEFLNREGILKCCTAYSSNLSIHPNKGKLITISLTIDNDHVCEIMELRFYENGKIRELGSFRKKENNESVSSSDYSPKFIDRSDVLIDEFKNLFDNLETESYE